MANRALHGSQLDQIAYIVRQKSALLMAYGAAQFAGSISCIRRLIDIRDASVMPGAAQRRELVRQRISGDSAQNLTHRPLWGKALLTQVPK